MINTGGIFADRLLGAILGLPAINLSTSFLPSLEAEPELFAIKNWIRGWSANVSCQYQPHRSEVLQLHQDIGIS